LTTSSNLSNRSLRFYRELCDKSFWYFVKLIGGSVHQGEDASEYIHRPVCEFWESKARRKAAAYPRDQRKSTIYTKWGTAYAYLRDPESRQLIAAENEKIASRFLDWIERQFLGNAMLRRLYPDKLSYAVLTTGEMVHPSYPDKDAIADVRLVDKSWTKQNKWSGTECALPRVGIYSEPSITAIGVRGAAQSGHYTTIRIDDLVGKEAMESQAVLEKVFEWQDNVQELLVEPDPTHPDASEIAIVGTHWGVGDYFDYVQEKYREFDWRIVPALKDTELIDQPHIQYIQNPTVEDGESNYPEKFKTQYYIDMMNNPEKELIFWAQHMNNPRKGSGLNKFDIKWLKFYRVEMRDEGMYIICKDDGEVFAVKDIPKYGMIDPGGFSETKLTKKGSRNAMLIAGQPRESVKKFVIFTHADRFKEPDKFMDVLFLAHNEYKPRLWRIDTAAQQAYIYKDIIQERKKRGQHMRISPMTASSVKDSKDDDIQAMINPIFNGEFYVHENMKELIAELGSYPHGMTKDLIDMLGKWYKHYGSRRPTKETDDLNKRDPRALQRGKPVNKSGGYG